MVSATPDITTLINNSLGALKAAQAQVDAAKERAEVDASDDTLQQAVIQATDLFRRLEVQHSQLLQLNKPTVRTTSTPNTVTASQAAPLTMIRTNLLKAPKPFQLGGDFEVFAEVFSNYVADKDLTTQRRVL